MGPPAAQVSDWLLWQRRRSVVPGPRDLLVETFPRGGRHYLVCYPFEGRLAHQTLGMLLTRRLERAGAAPARLRRQRLRLAVWGLSDSALVARKPDFARDLFDEDMLGDDLEAWLADALMKRAFNGCAIIAGLIERRFPGEEKSGRQVTFSTDLIYDVLRRHQPDHLLLRCASDDAATGLLDVGAWARCCAASRGDHPQPLDHVSPLAVPMMLEIGKERVAGEAAD